MALILCAASAFVGPTVPQLTVQKVFVDFETDVIEIQGVNFDNSDAPVVSLADYGVLPVVSTPTATSIIVVISAVTLLAGDNTLTVTTGTGTTKTDTCDLTIGSTGLQGEQGEQGIQCEQGEPGTQGEIGDKGDKGDKGDQGDQGWTGISIQ